MGASSLRRVAFNTKYRLFRRQALASARARLKAETCSQDELEAMNWSKRLALIQFAFERSSFYRQKYGEIGLEPHDIKDDAAWQRIPALTRGELRAYLDTILTVTVGSRWLGKSTTGGSTGVPVATYYDRRQPRETLAWRILRWWGLGPYDDGAYVWRMRRQGVRDAVNRLAWWPTRKLRLDASSMTPETINAFLTSFNRLRPPLLQGYTGALNHLALHVLQQTAPVHRPKAIWATSSPLGIVQRNQLERAFNAPVYDQYGSCEIPHIAAQCEQRRGLHMHHDAVHVEFVDDRGLCQPLGQPGRILVTDLDNHTFPLIRYENGDRGRALAGSCPCGITLPLMDTVSGRISDVLRLPAGGTLSGEYLTTLFDAHPDAVKQFQVRQHPDYSIVVSYIPNPAFGELSDVVGHVKKALLQRVAGQVPISLVPVETIEHDRGKLRFVISDLARLGSE